MTTDFSARDPKPGVPDLFHQRWSPRAFTGESIPPEQLQRLLDAARWSPSAFNEQPWRIYTSAPSTFDTYLGLLNEGNQAWARQASVIGFLNGRKRFSHNDKPNPTFELDCGAFWMALTLAARMEDLHTHGMSGIQFDAIAAHFDIDTDQEKVLMGFAIGHQGDANQLSESLQERETPTGRKDLTELWLCKS